MRAPALPTALGGLALATATTAAVFAATGTSFGGAADVPVRDPAPGRVVRLDRDAKLPADAIPTVAKARTAARIGTTSADRARLGCPSGAAALGTWCLDRDVRGTGTVAAASQACVRAGGWLPSAAQLLGAAPRVRLSGRRDDRPSTALVDAGQDLREISSTPFTTTTGSAAAGSNANPAPATLQVVTVYDNRDRGGFAGGSPVGAPGRFRCAFHKRAAGPAGRPRLVAPTLSARPGRAIAAQVQVPAGGRLEAAATVRAGGRTRTVAWGAARVRRAGAASVLLRPVPGDGRRLRGGRTARVTVTLTLRLRDGIAGSTRVRARLRVRP
ncbi:hypothetical protein [Patulibacter sp. SYSU D01012]|uniref:hypothetical protein n=1 Tax=Patulibacter sp. SYSU D01012 TaxID=2817381 RepID=UPI001B3135CD|nr:hypothetical protein [Patulibacter sp. SYSU D01012]